MEDDELIADEPAVPSHSKAYACLSTSIRWLEVQTNSDLLAAQLSRPLVTTWWAAKLSSFVTRFDPVALLSSSSTTTPRISIQQGKQAGNKADAEAQN